MTAPRLSVCIATLNRAGFLDQTLDALIAQAPDQVEIVVVDGASSDDTPQVVARHQARFAGLRYLRLAARGGVDQDFHRAVELAQGEYCWLMSDDDLLRPGALAAVLAALRPDCALVIVNAEVRSVDLSTQVEARRLHVSADRVYRPAEQAQLLADTAAYLSFIGGVVIRRDLWLARDPRQFFGTAFVHVGVIFHRPLPGDTLVLAEPWVIIRYGNAEWTARSFEIWMFKWPELVWSLPGYPDSARARVVPRAPWRRLNSLFRLRAKGQYSRAEYERWLRPRLTPGPARLAARLVADAPGCAVNWVMALYYTFVRPSRLELIDLRGSRFDYRACLRRLTGGARP